MGGHHEAPYKIPDYKVFKVEGHPQLEELERALAAKGLKDPWIRNEVWRYNPGFGNPRQRALSFFFRGLGVGVVLTGLTIVYDKITGSGSHGHGDHSDHH